MTEAFELAKNGFLIRYYYWSARQWEHEVKSGFPLLRAFGGFSTGALTTLEVMETMPSGDRSRLAGALVRRTHKEALLLLGLQIDPGDALLIQAWLEAVQTTPSMTDVGRAGRRANRSALRSALQAELRPLLGDEVRGADDAQLTFQQAIDSWSVQTNFDLGGRSHQIAYRHSVFLDGGFVKPDISPLVALGVTTTKLDRIAKGDEPAAARCVATLVRHFLEAEGALFATGSADLPQAL